MKDTFETLDDLMGILDDENFDSKLEDFLDHMAYSRKSVDEMLETLSYYDIWQIYDKLLTDFVVMLTPEERKTLKGNYKRIFSIPLPGEIE